MSFVQLLQSLRQLFIHLNLMYEFKLQNHNICTNNNKNNKEKILGMSHPVWN